MYLAVYADKTWKYDDKFLIILNIMYIQNTYNKYLEYIEYIEINNQSIGTSGICEP